MSAQELLEKLTAMLNQTPAADVVFEQEIGYRYELKDVSWDPEIPAIVLTITDQEED